MASDTTSEDARRSAADTMTFVGNATAIIRYCGFTLGGRGGDGGAADAPGAGGEPDRDAVVTRFVGELSPGDEALFRRLLGSQDDQE